MMRIKSIGLEITLLRYEDIHNIIFDPTSSVFIHPRYYL